MSESERDGQERPWGDAERARERLGEQMEDLRRGLGGIFTPEVRAHFRSARREFWLAMRSLIDARLEALEEDAKPQEPPPQRGKINID